MENPELKDYQIHQPPIGQGSYGVVYRATYRGISDRAVKVFKPDRVDLSTVSRELEKLSSVAEHPGIVTLHDFDLTTGSPYYAMGLHAREQGGGNWSARTLDEKCGKIDGREAYRLLSEIADAIAYLHRHQIIHCDIKPSNVLLTDESPPRIKICDFGQSRGTGIESFEPAGTPYYAPPEQLRSPQDSSEGRGFRWDVYAFGTLAYRLITGGLPRLQKLYETHQANANDPEATILDASSDETLVEGSSNRIRARQLADLIEKEPPIQWPSGRIHRSITVDIELKEIIERCLSLDPAARFADMREVSFNLKEIARHTQIKRSRRLIATFAILSLLAIVSAGFAVKQMRNARQASLAEQTAREEAEQLINFMLFDLGEKLRPIGRQELLEHVAENAESYISNLAEDRRSTRTLQMFAGILNNKGDVAAAAGNEEDALNHYLQAHNIAEQLMEIDDTGPGSVLQVAHSLVNIGSVHQRAGRLEEALTYYDQALDLKKRYQFDAQGEMNLNRAIVNGLMRIAEVYKTQGDPDAALDYYNDTLKLIREISGDRSSQEKAPSNPILASVLQEIGDIELIEGNFKLAAEHYQEAIAIADRLSNESKRSTPTQQRLAGLHTRLAEAHFALGDILDAKNQLLDALRIRSRVAKRDPSNIEWQLDLASAYSDVGDATEPDSNGANLDALTQYRKALEILDTLKTKPGTNLAEEKEQLAFRVESSIAAVIGDQLGQPSEPQ
ncbi:MAG: serine/threonine-protein kinase [Verrucomicrobiota bacterium]